MAFRRRSLTYAIAGLALLAVAAGATIAWRNGRVPGDPQSLLLRLPTQDAAVASIDFDALRKSGYLNLLDAAKTPEEQEYKDFVRDTGFDYKRDLDYVLTSFASDGSFFLVKGAFDWDKIEGYVKSHKGVCSSHHCRIAGSTPQRRISFFPLKHNILAMAVAPDDMAVSRLEKPGPQADIDIPSAPIWISLGSGAIRGATTLRGGAGELASALAGASRVTLTISPDGDQLAARLEALCRDAQQAGALTMELSILTSLVRDNEKRHAALHGPDDLASLLGSGKFQQTGAHVVGTWFITRSLLQNLTAGT